MTDEPYEQTHARAQLAHEDYIKLCEENGWKANSDQPLDDGGSAFPCEGGDMSGLHAQPGMTLRDWFAGQALMGLLAADAKYSGRTDNREAAATDAYAHADAMLAKRSKTGAAQ